MGVFCFTGRGDAPCARHAGAVVDCAACADLKALGKVLPHLIARAVLDAINLDHLVVAALFYAREHVRQGGITVGLRAAEPHRRKRLGKQRRALHVAVPRSRRLKPLVFAPDRHSANMRICFPSARRLKTQRAGKRILIVSRKNTTALTCVFPVRFLDRSLVKACQVIERRKVLKRISITAGLERISVATRAGFIAQIQLVAGERGLCKRTDLARCHRKRGPANTRVSVCSRSALPNGHTGQTLVKTQTCKGAASVVAA
jgi:hypothetical protein